ncbi:hypothetical protein CBR_g20095 [Chara braunii]|uniref:NB-ARC domain-containing protein n=1 Tax=Chara braunii TaxID=69332 RepID=A0A388KZT3_CHABU|nr:hypothetical protein CBR_g20095 [Chara braunii]|eukprot:GBG75463.1 hypothetical protein CBR_g20095 [Chara braunii]
MHMMRLYFQKRLQTLQSDLKELRNLIDSCLVWEIHGRVEASSSSNQAASGARSFVPMPIEDHIYGIDEDVTVLIATLESSNGPDIVCIHGMGGVGKTTLATQIYDSGEIRREFRHGVFFMPCGQDMPAQALIDKFWTRMHGHALDTFYSDLEQESKLKTALQGKRVLIVIDDVWHTEQIAWTERNFPTRCGIIITTRDRDIVRKATLTHLVEPLGRKESFEFFCQWAFGGKDPIPELEEVVRKVCEKCDGMPLALRVVGSNISPRHKDIEFWESWLDFLERSNPSQAHSGANCDIKNLIMKVFERSINPLADTSKLDLLDMFLDLAALPKDHFVPIDVIEVLWSVYPSVGNMHTAMERLRTLIRLNLVDERNNIIVGVNYIGLHDMIRQPAIDVTAMSKTAPPVVLGRPNDHWNNGRFGDLQESQITCESAQLERMFITKYQTVAPDANRCLHAKKLMWIGSKPSAQENIFSSCTVMPNLVSFYWSIFHDPKFCARASGGPRAEECDLSVGQFLVRICKLDGSFQLSWERCLEFLSGNKEVHERSSTAQFLNRIRESRKLQVMILLHFPEPGAIPDDYFSSFHDL